MKKIILTLTIMICATQVFANETKNLSADEALLKLKEGNQRFSTAHMEHPHETKAYRGTLVKGQHPFVAILSCSDSRVPTEIIFDEGLGDIFVIRNAGNILDEHIIGSIEYAIEHCGVKLVVVMGHECCGAVGAAMKAPKDTKEIESIIKSIKPAIEKCKKENNYSYESVIKENVSLVVDKLTKDKHIQEYIEKDNVKIIPAYYHLDTGKVDFLCK